MTATEVLQLARDILVIAAALFLIVASIVVVRLARRLEARLNRIEEALDVVKTGVKGFFELLPLPAKGLLRVIPSALGFLAHRTRKQPK